MSVILVLMMRLPPGSTRTATLLPCTTLFRSRQRLLAQVAADRGIGLSETHRDLRIPVRCLHFVDHHAAAHVGDADAGRLELVIETFGKTIETGLAGLVDRKSTRLNSSH